MKDGKKNLLLCCLNTAGDQKTNDKTNVVEIAKCKYMFRI